MSYILDALRKSSEERRKLQESEEQQSPLPLVSSQKQHLRRQYRFPALLILVTICIFAIASWWFGSEQPTDDISSPSTTSEPPPTRAEPKATQSPLPAATVIHQMAPSEQTIAPNQQPAAATNPELKTEESTVEKVVPRQEELPLAIRSQIPEMKFSGHVFSENPELRMILINTDIAREGAQIDADLKLLEITENGLIMNFKGTNFRVDLF